MTVPGAHAAVRPSPRNADPLAPHLTEAQLTALWRGRRFPDGALVTRAGVPVRVIFAGRPGRGPGPDFRGAAIAGPSGATVRGDVELHVRASDFRAHGHERDAAYARVILHLVFEDDTGADTPLFGGGTAPIVALAPWVARRADELRHWLERPLLWREPCHGAVMRLGAEGAAAALDAEGDRRLEARAAEVAAHIAEAGLEQALYERLLAALGFGGNGPPMRALARLLPWELLRSRTAAGEPAAREALLLGSAGLLPSQRGHGSAAEPHIAALERAFAASGLPALAATDWRLWGVRPANAPARRLAAAAAVLSSLGAPAAVLRFAEASTASEAIAPLLSLPTPDYWRTHHDPCAGAARGALPPALIGRDRALEILINVALPAAIASGDGAGTDRARALWRALPRPGAYGATRFIERALASEDAGAGGASPAPTAGRVRVPINARRAQGLLALQRDWCERNGCGRCPLS